MPINQPKSVYSLLRSVIDHTGLQLSFELSGGMSENSDSESGSSGSTSGSGQLLGVFTGPDTAMLTSRNGELLHALEHLAAKVLQLEPEQHDRVSFDADGYKETRDRLLQESAERGIVSVRTTGRPYSFPVMNSRERRLLHLALKESGLPTASSGEMPRRFVVLYPESYVVSSQAPAVETGTAAPATPDRVQAIRNSFRRR